MLESEMRRAERDNENDDRHRRQRQPQRDAAAVFRPEEIDDADDEDERHGGDLRIARRDAEITDGGPSAERGGDHEICHQQERARRGEEATLLARRGVDATAIRKVRADDDVIVGHHRRQHADSEDDGERGKAGRDKSQTDDIRLARPPIAVEKRGGAFPIHITRTMDARGGVEREVGHEERTCLFALMCSNGQALLPPGRQLRGHGSGVRGRGRRRKQFRVLQMHDALNLRCLREHVQRCYRDDGEGCLQFAEITRERGGIAGNVNERRGRMVQERGPRSGRQTRGWRIHDDGGGGEIIFAQELREGEFHVAREIALS